MTKRSVLTKLYNFFFATDDGVYEDLDELASKQGIIDTNQKILLKHVNTMKHNSQRYNETLKHLQESARAAEEKNKKNRCSCACIGTGADINVNPGGDRWQIHKYIATKHRFRNLE